MAAGNPNLVNDKLVLPAPLALDGGQSLPQVEVAYETIGTLNSEKSNAILLFHALTMDQHVVSKHPRTGKPVKPTTLGGKPLQLEPQEDPRGALAAWLTAPENPFFARMFANRYWKHFFSRALVEPEDDLRITNPPVNPALLDALHLKWKKNFPNHSFAMKMQALSIVMNMQSQSQSSIADISAEFQRHQKS